MSTHYSRYEDSGETHGWETNLFDCIADPKICLMSTFCPCYQGALLLAAIDAKECGCQEAMKMLFCCFCYLVQARSLIRKKYSIDGSVLVDILTLLCCPFCAVSQQVRQWELHERPLGTGMDKL